jgi:hypothetical protein
LVAPGGASGIVINDTAATTGGCAVQASHPVLQ